ncbi:hypothetical protein AVEN_238374-1 [Araneus ventricosus]|uniref:Uncharacterized protein n=1 Tax=Araneus ventricosus TaxID=182803 RepID=A0A4Y2K888_ARAVE|nr:hypothetical protein AVEN_238374-1 [Araneus ventricosus]
MQTKSPNIHLYAISTCLNMDPSQCRCNYRLLGCRWIGRGGPVAWPSRSPDLSPLVFISGALKALLYETQVHSNMYLPSLLLRSIAISCDLSGIFENDR